MAQSPTDTKQQQTRKRADRLALIADRELSNIIKQFSKEKTGGIIERLVHNVEAARGEARRHAAQLQQLAEEMNARREGGELLDQMPPSNMDAELAVLGSVLFQPTCVTALRKQLDPDEFYCLQNQAIYRRMLWLDENEKPIDTLLLSEALKQSGEYQMVGGAIRLAEILEGCPTAANVFYYAKIVKAQAEKRRLVNVAIWLLKETHSNRAAEGVSAELRERVG